MVDNILDNQKLQYHEKYCEARSILRRVRNREDAIGDLKKTGMQAGEATLMVDYIMAYNLHTGRSNGFKWALAGMVFTALFIAVFMFTGRLYYIILPISIGIIAKGIQEAVTSNPWEG